MAVRLKANIAFQPIVEEVSRKFVPKKETCSSDVKAGPVSVESKGWMGAGVRQTYRAGLGACKRNYMVIRSNARSSVVSEEEQQARTRFVKAVEGMNYIRKDLQQISRVQALWDEAQDDLNKELNGVSAEGYTFRGWIMAVQYYGLYNDPTYNHKNFPQSFDA